MPSTGTAGIAPAPLNPLRSQTQFHPSSHLCSKSSLPERLHPTRFYSPFEIHVQKAFPAPGLPTHRADKASLGAPTPTCPAQAKPLTMSPAGTARGVSVCPGAPGETGTRQAPGTLYGAALTISAGCTARRSVCCWFKIPFRESGVPGA